MSSETSHSAIDSACVDAALTETRRFFRGMPTVIEALDYFKQELRIVVRNQAGLSQPTEPAVVICKLSVEVDTSQVDAALAKVEELKQALVHLSKVPASVAVTS